MFLTMPPEVKPFLRGDVLPWRRRDNCVLTSVKGHLRSSEQTFFHSRHGMSMRFNLTLYVLNHIAKGIKTKKEIYFLPFGGFMM